MSPRPYATIIWITSQRILGAGLWRVHQFDSPQKIQHKYDKVINTILVKVVVDRPIKSRPTSFAHYTPQIKLIVFVEAVDLRRQIPGRSADLLSYPDAPLEYPQVDGGKGTLMRS